MSTCVARVPPGSHVPGPVPSHPRLFSGRFSSSSWRSAGEPEATRRLAERGTLHLLRPRTSGPRLLDSDFAACVDLGRLSRELCEARDASVGV